MSTGRTTEETTRGQFLSCIVVAVGRRTLEELVLLVPIRESLNANP
jgi:hypothetical protein